MNRRDDILEAAERLLAVRGPEGLTMRQLADALGIKAPSLYKHFPDKAAIEAALQEKGLREQSAALSTAAPGLSGLASAYRAWALAHPHLYGLLSRQRLHRDRLAPGVEDSAAALLLREVGGDIDRARALWGLAHGLVELELAGRFPEGTDLDAVWRVGISGFEPRRQGFR
jgi:AcrR family transcriptional regulator